MAEEATRRLLKVFGIAVTEFEETVQQVLADAEGAVARGGGAEALLPLLATLFRAEGDLTGRWTELTRLVGDTRGRAYAELTRLLAQTAKR